MYGIYTNQGKSEPFLIIGVTDYEMMYTNMFIWESTLALDIKDIFPNLKNLFDLTKKQNNSILLVETPIETSSSTSTNTPSISSNSTSSLNKVISTSTPISTSTHDLVVNEVENKEAINRTIRFIDSVFSNKDARTVRDQYGNPFFYYSFIDKTKILFAQDPKLIQEITKKIKNKNLVR